MLYPSKLHLPLALIFEKSLKTHRSAKKRESLLLFFVNTRSLTLSIMQLNEEKTGANYRGKTRKSWLLETFLTMWAGQKP